LNAQCIALDDGPHGHGGLDRHGQSHVAVDGADELDLDRRQRAGAIRGLRGADRPDGEGIGGRVGPGEESVEGAQREHGGGGEGQGGRH
jgi:hypothetical protein